MSFWRAWWPPLRERKRALAGGALVVAGVAAASPTLLLIGLCVVTATLLTGLLPRGLALVGAVLTLLTAATTAGLVAGHLHVNLLAHPSVLAALFLGYAVLGLSVRDPRESAVRRSWPDVLTAVAQIPAVLSAIIGLVQLAGSRPWIRWAFEGTDFAGHLMIVRDQQTAGALVYNASSTYPRGLHALLALVSTPRAPIGDPADLLRYDGRLLAAAVWLSLAVVLTTGASLAIRVSAKLGVDRLWGASAAFAFGVAVLLDDHFLSAFVYMGAVPSILTLAVMWSIPLAVMAPRQTVTWRAATLVPLGALNVFWLANLWQALVVVPVAAVTLLAVPGLFRRGAVLDVWRVLARRPRVALCLAAVTVLALAGAIAPLTSVQRTSGLQLSAAPGGLSPTPPLGLGMALVSTVVVVAWSRRAWARALLGSALGLLACVLVLLHSAGQGADLAQYYPRKALWFFVLFSAPVAWALVAYGVSHALRRVGRGRALAPAAIGLIALVAIIVPATELGSGHRVLLLHSVGVDGDVSRLSPVDRSKARVSPVRWEVATRYATAFAPLVAVPVRVGRWGRQDAYGTAIVSRLMSFETGQPVVGDVDQLCDQVRTGASGRVAVVLTARRTDGLRASLARQGCLTRVVRVPAALR